jgi:biotin operon repressor
MDRAECFKRAVEMLALLVNDPRLSRERIARFLKASETRVDGYFKFARSVGIVLVYNKRDGYRVERWGPICSRYVRARALAIASEKPRSGVRITQKRRR